jgi:hypothetical protein
MQWRRHLHRSSRGRCGKLSRPATPPASIWSDMQPARGGAASSPMRRFYRIKGPPPRQGAAEPDTDEYRLDKQLCRCPHCEAPWCLAGRWVRECLHFSNMRLAHCRPDGWWQDLDSVTSKSTWPVIGMTDADAIAILRVAVRAQSIWLSSPAKTEREQAHTRARQAAPGAGFAAAMAGGAAPAEAVAPGT